MNILLGVVSTLCVVVGAALLFVAAVIVFQPRWYRRRWGGPPRGRLAPFYSAPFTLSDGRKRPSLYFWAGGGAPYDDVVVGQGLDDTANDDDGRRSSAGDS